MSKFKKIYEIDIHTGKDIIIEYISKEDLYEVLSKIKGIDFITAAEIKNKLERD